MNGKQAKTLRKLAEQYCEKKGLTNVKGANRAFKKAFKKLRWDIKERELKIAEIKVKL
jgi:hypothetical protein